MEKWVFDERKNMRESKNGRRKKYACQSHKFFFSPI